MKYPQVVSMPSAVSDWLEEQLEVRGIDAVVYTRYILSLLHTHTFDVIYPDDDLPFSRLNKEVGRRSIGRGRKRSRRSSSFHCTSTFSSSDWWLHAHVDAERIKRSAAVECLVSLSDQDGEIETLIDELFKHVEQLRSPISPTLISSSSTDKSSDNISLQEQAAKYYAAFPPLKLQSSGQQNNWTAIEPKWTRQSVEPKWKRQLGLDKTRKGGMDPQKREPPPYKNNRLSQEDATSTMFSLNIGSAALSDSENYQKEEAWGFTPPDVITKSRLQCHSRLSDQSDYLLEVSQNLERLMESPNEERGYAKASYLPNMENRGNECSYGVNLIDSIWSEEQPPVDDDKNNYNCSTLADKQQPDDDDKNNYNWSVWSDEHRPLDSDNNCNWSILSDEHRLLDSDNNCNRSIWSDEHRLLDSDNNCNWSRRSRYAWYDRQKPVDNDNSNNWSIWSVSNYLTRKRPVNDDKNNCSIRSNRRHIVDDTDPYNRCTKYSEDPLERCVGRRSKATTGFSNYIKVGETDFDKFIEKMNGIWGGLKLLNHSRESSSFAEVPQKLDSIHPTPIKPIGRFNQLVNSRPQIFCETEDLLTSKRTHFKPINEKLHIQIDNGYENGATFNVCSDFYKVDSRRTQSGTIWLDGGLGFKKYHEYKYEGLLTTAKDFTVKFPESQNNIAIQTSDQEECLACKADDARAKIASLVNLEINEDQIHCVCHPFSNDIATSCPVHVAGHSFDKFLWDDFLTSSEHLENIGDLNNLTMEDNDSFVATSTPLCDTEISAGILRNVWLSQVSQTDLLALLREDIRLDGEQLLSVLNHIDIDDISPMYAFHSEHNLSQSRRSFVEENPDAWNIAARLEEDCALPLSSLSQVPLQHFT